MPSGVPKTRDEAIRTSPFTQPAKPGEETGLERDPEPESTSELEALRQQVAELMRAQAFQAAESERVKQELRENQAIVARIIAEKGDIDQAAIEAKWRVRELARRRIYEHVRGRKVVLMIHRHQDPSRNAPVHVNLNGKFYDLIPGVPTEVEGEFLEVLDHASVANFVMEVDEYGNPKRRVLDYFSYPYQVISGLEGLTAADVSATA